MNILIFNANRYTQKQVFLLCIFVLSICSALADTQFDGALVIEHELLDARQEFNSIRAYVDVALLIQNAAHKI